MHQFPLTEFVLSFGFGYVLGVVLHELGHLVVARVVRLPVFKVVFGLGPPLWTRSIRGLSWEIRPLPLGGMVILILPVYISKYRYMLVVLGGVLANVGFIVVLNTIWDLPLRASPALQGLIWSQIFLIGIALFPIAVTTNEVYMPSDGHQLAHYWKQPRRALSPLGEVYFRHLSSYAGTTRARDAFSPASDRLAALHLKISQLDTREQIATFRGEAGKGDHSQAEELLILDGLMTRTLRLSEYDPLELCEWAERALMLGPDIPTIQFTIGGVLIELGRYAEGIDCIQTAIGVDDKPFDTVISTTFLARAEHALGNHEKAKELAQSALKLAYLTDRIGGGDHDGFLRGTEDFLRKMDTALASCDNGHPSMSGQAHAPSQ